ncbi:hypothetical protein COOONC_04920 [Cooperia oncophora]
MGSMPKVIEIGKKPRKLLDGEFQESRNRGMRICQRISDHAMHSMQCYTDLEATLPLNSAIIHLEVCLNDRVARYCQRSVHLASQAMEKHNLETYEVSIEDEKREALICFRVMFRRVPRFLNKKLRSLAVPELCQLKEDLSEVLLSLLSMEIPAELSDTLEDTHNTLRVITLPGFYDA